MRALTVNQPWAHAIMYGDAKGEIKDIENRSKPTKHRGIIAIHGNFGPRTPFNEKRYYAWKQLLKRDYGYDMPTLEEHLTGILGTVELVDCTQNHPSKWAQEGMYHWVLDNPRPICEPIPCKGMLGLWRIPEYFTLI